jgi:hypothetical protein
MKSALPDTSCTCRIFTAARSSPTSPDGVRYSDQICFESIIERGRLVDESCPRIVYAGFSLRILPALV